MTVYLSDKAALNSFGTASTSPKYLFDGDLGVIATMFWNGQTLAVNDTVQFMTLPGGNVGTLSANGPITLAAGSNPGGVRITGMTFDTAAVASGTMTAKIGDTGSGRSGAFFNTNALTSAVMSSGGVAIPNVNGTIGYVYTQGGYSAGANTILLTVVTAATPVTVVGAQTMLVVNYTGDY